MGIFPVGYGAQTAKKVTIKNTGNTQTFKIKNTDPKVITVSRTTPVTLKTGASTTFTFTPKTGLKANYHTALIIVDAGGTCAKSAKDVGVEIFVISKENWISTVDGIPSSIKNGKTMEIKVITAAPVSSVYLKLNGDINKYTMKDSGYGTIWTKTITPKATGNRTIKIYAVYKGSESPPTTVKFKVT